MDNHHIKLFVVDGNIVYIHHSANHPNDDDPGPHLRAPKDDKVRFKAPKDGGFRIEFDTESPFVSGAGRPGFPIVSNDGSQTPLEILKPIGTVTKSFKYSVQIAGLDDDPEIIIDNSGGGGGGGPKKKRKK
jgi:hypothetical protein